MTDPTPDPAQPDPTVALDAAPPERERIQPAPAGRRDLLPFVYLLGFVVLSGALAYLWQNPPVPDVVAEDTTRLDALEQQVQALATRVGQAADRVTQIEQRPAPQPVAPAPVPEPPPAVDLRPLEQRIAQLEARPVPEPPPAPGSATDVTAIASRLDSIASRQEALNGRQTTERTELASQRAELAGRIDAFEARVAGAEQKAGQVADVAQSATRISRLQSAMAALEAGQPIGPLPGASPALARFAATPPPTEAALRLAFPEAAEAAHRASQPAISGDQPFLNRIWTRAQQVVTVRQGDRVLLGDPIAGVLAQAQQRLDAGDLAGAVAALDGLAGPAAAAMSDWTGRARALLEARSSLTELAAQR